MSYFEKIKLLFLKRPLKLEKPKVIQFPVVDICNSKCQMCRIWENKKSDDISVNQLREGLLNDLFSEVEVVGFNGGEPTLRKDLSCLVQVAIDSLPALTGISLITNAYNYQDVIDEVERIGLICKKHKVHFDLMVSLDGYAQVHDLVRGKKGNFERAKHVIEYAKKSDIVSKLRIGCTVIRDNVYHLPDLLDFCIENDLYIKYRLGVPHQRLYTKDLTAPYALTEEERYEFVEFLEGVIKFYEKGYLQNHFYRSLINQVLYDSPRRAGCDWQHRGATITAKGELAYCAVKSKVLMNDISEGDPQEFYFSNQNYLSNIIKNSCDSCNHDYVGIPNRKDYLEMIFHALNVKFDVKGKLKSLPGYKVVHSLRSKFYFKRYYKHFDSMSNSIKLLSNDKLKSKKIMICGWYGTETLGDKAIIAGVIDSLKSTFDSDLNLSVASLFPYVTEITKKQMPELNGVSVVSVNDAVASIANYDYLLFGGGPMMAINELAPMQSLFEKAKKANVITIASGVGVGPLGEKWLNDSIVSILNLCDFRIYRDTKSLKLAESLGVDVKRDQVAEDPAFTWLKKFNDKIDVAENSSNSKILLLGLRDFPYREYAAELSDKKALEVKGNFERSIIETLEKLVESDGSWVIKPLPMCTNHLGDDDRWFYRRLLRCNKNLKPYIDYSLLGNELTPTEYVNAFKGADVLLGMRFHSIVFGLGVGTKTVAIDYTMGRGKVKSLSDRFGVSALPMVGLSSQMILNELKKALNGNTTQVENICNNLLFENAMRKFISAGNAL